MEADECDEQVAGTGDGCRSESLQATAGVMG